MAKLMFENRFLLTRKLHREYYRYVFRKLQKRLQLICLLLALLCAAGAVLVLLLWKQMLIVGILGFMAVYFAVMIFGAYRFREWLDFRQLVHDHGEGIVNIVEFRSDQVHVKVNKTAFSFKYDTIKGAYETEEMYILILETKGMIEHGQILYKNGFKEGTDREAFADFINRKCGKEILEDHTENQEG